MEKVRTENVTVVKHTGSHYWVSPLPLWKPVCCVIRGKIRTKELYTTNPIAVGDLVDYQPQTGENAEGYGVITKIHPRKNYIIRKSVNLSRQAHIIAANIDTAFLVFTLAFPETMTAFADRFLVTCEAYRVPAVIILNKIDLMGSYREETEIFKEIYRGAGYPVIETSAITGEGIEGLRELCRGKLSLISGISGTGKSSLINSLDPSLNLRTGDISDYHLQGKHTTTFYEIHPVKSGGYIIDTPGIRGFGLIEMADQELSHYFPEMLRVLDGCRFSPCTHTHEPGCAVKEALDRGEISPERYSSYLGMLQEETKYR
ncbi:MAG: ribosome small subunit-dependent GTPase A [Bacteroidales bacterium]|nr:ribosome small subunit-dependent GTPase A [Bacteroidales bacterium]MDD2425983.1 ribosome small subunit-dependent GTPase A [Bacteroidales bacterium]MDD3990218.1 ribosome small subunit-dependent GTPase A [Bacteroidales bacterium]